MMKTIYTLLIELYTLLIVLFSPFNEKARLWFTGRKKWREKLSDFDKQGHVMWVHCASLGEFEQGRPLIEKVKGERPDWKVVLTFFSPSGYEIRKNYNGADIVMYLPSDTPGNARDFIKAINPDVAVFVKYEFWYNYLDTLRKNNIPVYLVSGIFRPDQLFFRWYGGFYRSMIYMFEHIFVQNKESMELLKGIQYNSCSVTGDTRFDRVSQIAGMAKELPVISAFRGDERLFVAGSSWDPDEEIITTYINENPNRMKWLFAPHEIDEAHLSRIEHRLNVPSVRYSAFKHDSDARVMIIDNIGMLSSVYQYASVAAVGGGFGKGIHNILEPACWGIPVLFGPRYEKFKEAVELIEKKGASSFNNYEGFKGFVDVFLNNSDALQKAGEICSAYIAENKGATDIVYTLIFGKH